MTPKQIDNQKTMFDILLKLQNKYKANAHDFYRVFKKRLKPFWDNMFGLDVFKLDDDILHPKENESSKEATLRLFGNEGWAIIQKLLSVDDEGNVIN